MGKAGPWHPKCYAWDPVGPAVLNTRRDSELLRRSVFTTPPRFTTPQTLLWEEKCLQFPRKWCPHEARRNCKSQCDSNSLRVLNLLRVVLATQCSGRGPENGNFPKVVRRGCERRLGPRAPNSSCIDAKKGCTGAKHPLLTTFGKFPLSGPLPKPRGPNTTRSESSTRSEFTIALWFSIAVHLARTPFPGNYTHFSSPRRVRGVVNMGVVVKTTTA